MKAMKEEPKKRKKRAQTLKESSRQESSQSSNEDIQEAKTLSKCIEQSQSEWWNGIDREEALYSEAVAMDTGAMMDGVLMSVVSDVSKMEALTNKNDVYALNSLVSVKLKVHKAISERGRYYKDMLDAYSDGGVGQMKMRLEVLEKENESLRNKLDK